MAHFERVEFLTLDPFSAQGALSRGEIDWWESPSRDLADQIARDRNVTLVSHYMPAMGIMRFNQLYPPFDKAVARRAMLNVIDQAEAMTAVAGADPANRLDGIGLFSHGTPLANDAGIEVLRRPRDPAAANKGLSAAGYGGEKIVVIAPTEVAGIRALSLIGAEQMRRAGINVDLQEMDFGSVVRRRTSQAPPDKGGWHVFFTMIDRSIPNIHPFGNPALRADGKAAYDGWPESWKIEELRRRLARRRRPGDRAPHRRRFAEAGVDRHAVHPDGRILADHRLPQGHHRPHPRLLLHLLRRTASVSRDPRQRRVRRRVDPRGGDLFRHRPDDGGLQQPRPLRPARAAKQPGDALQLPDRNSSASA